MKVTVIGVGNVGAAVAMDYRQLFKASVDAVRHTNSMLDLKI